MISTVNARMDGKERPATPRTVSAMRTPATMGAPAMTRGIHLSACVLLDGKAPLVTLQETAVVCQVLASTVELVLSAGTLSLASAKKAGKAQHAFRIPTTATHIHATTVEHVLMGTTGIDANVHPDLLVQTVELILMSASPHRVLTERHV